MKKLTLSLLGLLFLSSTFANNPKTNRECSCTKCSTRQAIAFFTKLARQEQERRILLQRKLIQRKKYNDILVGIVEVNKWLKEEKVIF